MSVKSYSFRENLFGNLSVYKKSRFYGRLSDAILNNGFEAVGIWGAKGLGKSTLQTTIAKEMYGSWDVARQFRITRRDELPRLIELVQNDSRYWIKYGDVTLKRIPVLSWDDIAVDMPSTEANKQDFVAFHKYFMTIRSHVAVLLGSFPDWSDFRRRMKVSFTGEIALQWTTRKLSNGNVVRRRKGEALWFRNRPDYYKKYHQLEGKEHAIPIVWDDLPKYEMQREIEERTHLANRLLQGVRDSVKAKARIYSGQAGTQDQHLLEWEKELLGVIYEAVKHRPLKIGNTKHINDKYLELYKMKFDYLQLKKYLTVLDSKELITYRQGDNRWGEVAVTDLGTETISLIRGIQL